MKNLATNFLALTIMLVVFGLPGWAQIKDVKNIYLAPFGNDVSADLIREKIRSRLVASNYFVLVEKPDQADAVFTGVADFEKVENGTLSGVSNKRGGGIWGETNTDFNAIGVFRLVHPETKATLWIYDYKPKWYRVSTGANKANEEYNRIAKRVVEKMIKDVNEPAKTKPTTGGK